jgi:hypothetical protein
MVSGLGTSASQNVRRRACHNRPTRFYTLMLEGLRSFGPFSPSTLGIVATSPYASQYAFDESRS